MTLPQDYILTQLENLELYQLDDFLYKVCDKYNLYRRCTQKRCPGVCKDWIFCNNPDKDCLNNEPACLDCKDFAFETHKFLQCWTCGNNFCSECAPIHLSSNNQDYDIKICLSCKNKLTK